MPAAELLEAITGSNPAWMMRVMLAEYRAAGASFDAAWAASIQRMRVHPTMEPADAEELLAAKAELWWAKERWRWAYDGLAGTPPNLADEPDMSLDN